MASEVVVFGNVTSTSRRTFADGDAQAELSPQGAILVSAPIPFMSEMTRMGASYSATQVTPVAALTAFPTTAAAYSLWNGEADGGKVYAIDSFGCVEVVVDATQQNQLALFALMGRGRVSAPTAEASGVIGSMTGRASYGGTGRTTLAATTVTADGWTPHGPIAASAGAVAGGAWRVHEASVPVGSYIVRPGGIFHLHAAKIAATASQLRFFIRWHELNIKLVD